MGEEVEAQLIAEQLRHTIDLLRAELEKAEQIQRHDRDLADHRLRALEEQARDHENRLRMATDGVTQFKVWLSLAAGSSGLMSLAALLRAWFGG